MSKYKVGDKVWLIAGENNQVEIITIIGLTIDKNETHYLIKYLNNNAELSIMTVPESSLSTIEPLSPVIMAWSDVMPIMLRYMINDYGSPQTYTDNILLTALLVNATFVSQELDFSQIFIPDLVNLRLTPDPTGPTAPVEDSMGNILSPSAPPDYNYINLVVLRTAVMINMNEYRTATNSAIMFKEFHSQADMRGIATAKKAMWDELQKLYDEKRMGYQIGIRVSGQAILSPINIIAGGWRGPIFVYSDRDRFVI